MDGEQARALGSLDCWPVLVLTQAGLAAPIMTGMWSIHEPRANGWAS